MATLLSTIQQVCGRLAQPVPNTVFGSSDKQVVQMMRLLEEGLDDLSGRGAWERLVKEITWTTVALEDQGDLYGTGLGSGPTALSGFRYWLPQTAWDRTTKLPLVGGLDAQDWQAIQAMVITGPRYQFRIRGGKFLVNPAPTAGLTWAFEYVSEFMIALTGSSNPTLKRFTLDTNDILLPDQIVQMDLRWRWKKEKNLPYAEDFNTCEKMVMDALGRDGAKRTLRLDDRGDGGPQPGIYVTPMSWPL